MNEFNYNGEVKALDWNEVIDDEPMEFVVLDPGDYNFIIENVEKAYYEAKPGGKLPSCPMVTVTLGINSPKGDAHVRENFYLASSTSWKIAQFYASIGLKRKGESVRMDWDNLIGKKGAAKITKEKGSQGGDFNNVKSFLMPSGYDNPGGAAPSWQAGAY